MFKVNNRNTRARSEICSKLTIKIPERRQGRRSGIFIVNFEHNFTPCSSVSIVHFEQVNTGWEIRVWLRLLRFITSNKKILSKALQGRVFLLLFITSFPVENGGINILKFTFHFKLKCLLEETTCYTHNCCLIKIELKVC